MKRLLFIVFLTNCGQDRIFRESNTTIIKDEERLDPVLVLKQEIINCSKEEDLCRFEKFQTPIYNQNQINGIIYPDAEIINSEDISLAPTLEFTFENIDYTEIEKIEYKYIKYTNLGEKVAETDYKVLSFFENTYKIPIHISNMGGGILNSEPENINQIEILIKNTTNIYYKSLINFYLFSSLSFPIDIYRDPELINSEYYQFQNKDFHTLDAINFKNNLNSKTLINLAIEINNTTKASIQSTHKINNKQNVSYYSSFPIYLWSVAEDLSYSISEANPNFSVIKVDDYNTVSQIPFILSNNTIVIENFEIDELEHIKLIIQTNFDKLNILGGQNIGTIYTNHSHCENIESLNFCKCRYSPHAIFDYLLAPPEDPIYFVNIILEFYQTLYSVFMTDTTVVPNCTNPPERLVLTATNIYKTNNVLLGRHHKTNTSIFLDIYLKNYLNFGVIGSKYLILPNLEVTSGIINQTAGLTYLSGYLLNEE